LVLRFAQPLRAAEQAADPREQDRELGRLVQVIVRSRRESLQHVFRPSGGCQHQDGNELLGGSKLRHDGKSVLPGQHHVEDDEIEMGAAMPEEALERPFSGIDDLGLKAFRFEVEAQSFGEVQLVFDDEYALHVRRPAPSAAAA
jgi:hypothetical protein